MIDDKPYIVNDKSRYVSESNYNENKKTAYYKNKISTVPYNYTGAVATFVDDDAKLNFFNIWKRICDLKDIRVTLGVVPNWLGSSYYQCMDIAQLKALKKDNYDFVCHTWNHDAAVFKSTNNLALVTDSAIEDEFKKGQDWFINNGFPGYDTVVYPHGQFSTDQAVRYKRLARKYFKQGVNAGGNINTAPNDNMYLGRTFINKTNPISTYTAKVDQAITSNGWLIFGTHSNDSEISYEYLLQLVEYIISKNIPILTFNEALKYKGNVLSVGEYSSSKKLYVSPSGDILGNQYKILDGLVPDNGFTFDSPISAFPVNCVSVLQVKGSGDTFFNEGGRLTTFYSWSGSYFNAQEYTLVYSQKTYRRYWNESNQAWTSFVLVNSPKKSATITSQSTDWLLNTDVFLTEINEVNGLVTGSVSLSNVDNDGTFAHDFNVVNYTGVTLPRKKIIVPGTYFTNTGTVAQCAFSIANESSVGKIRFQGSRSTADIRYAFITFTYSI